MKTSECSPKLACHKKQSAIEEVRKDRKQYGIVVEQRAKELVLSRVNKALYDNFISIMDPFLLCIGPGGGFHPVWKTVDRIYDGNLTWSEAHGRSRGPEPDYEWDALKRRSLPLESGSVDGIYCSHMIEHLPKNVANWFLSECYRLLRPKGVLRIVTPDVDLAVNAFDNNDWMFFLEHQALHEDVAITDEWLLSLRTEKSQQDYAAWRLLDMFSMIMHPSIADEIGLTCDTCLAFIRDHPNTQAAVDEACKLSDTAHGRRIGCHMSCWKAAGLKRESYNAGFSSVERSHFRQSRSPFMRHLFYFDRTDPHNSLFVEAEK